MDHIPVAERLLEGLWVLDMRCGEGLNDSRLVKRLRERGAKALVQAANKAAAYYTSGGGKVWAQGMLADLNKGLQKKFHDGRGGGLIGDNWAGQYSGRVAPD